MNPETGGAVAGGATGGAPAGGTTAPAVTPPPAVNSGAPVTPPVTPPPAPASPPASADWVTGLPDDLKGYAQIKGFQDPAAVLKAYQHAEKKLGVKPEDLVQVPKDHDLEGHAALMRKLGVPEKPDGYGLTPSANASAEEKETLTRLAGWFHENQVTPRQAKGLLGKVMEFSATETKRQTDAAALATEMQFQELKKDWGLAYDANRVTARQTLQNARAAGAISMDDAAIDQLEKTVGFGPLMRLMHWVGSKSQEPNLVAAPAGGAPSFAVVGPQAAKASIKEMMGNSDTMRKVRKSGTVENARWTDLHKTAYPG